MRLRGFWVLCLLPALLGPAQEKKEDPGDPAARAKRESLLKLYTGEAAEYTIYRDSSRKERVLLQREPVYVWTNPIRGGEQDGAVFVWTCRGRAEAVGTFFSYPAAGPRNLNHELHSLAVTALDVTREGAHSFTWAPRAPGIEPTPIKDAPAPGRSPSQRLTQMRALMRDFTATTQDLKDKKWELRLLPQPLYRYESTDPDVIDGAVFSFVTSAGTDPEALVVIEARKAAASSAPAWHYAVGRFTDLHLWVRLKGKEVFSGPLIPYDTPQQDPKDRYRSFRDRSIPAVEEHTP
jgi:hypothetical protein